jgi:hypothetical protein
VVPPGWGWWGWWCDSSGCWIGVHPDPGVEGQKDRGHRYAVLLVRSLSSLLADRLARVTKVEAKPITSTASANQGA